MDSSKKILVQTQEMPNDSGYSPDKLLNNDCFSIQSVKSVAEASRDFLKKDGLLAFEFARVYDSGHAIVLYSNPLISKYVIENKVHLIANVPQAPKEKDFWYVPDSNGPYQKLLSDINHIAGGKGFADLIERFHGYIDMFCWWSPRDQGATSTKFLNIKEKAEAFSHQIREQLAHLLSRLGANPFPVPAEMRPNFTGLSKGETRERIDLSQVSTKKGVNVAQLFSQAEALQLSHRERQIVAFLTEGRTAREIAKNLGLSYRTVQNYLQTTKEKVGCSKKSEIISSLLAGSSA